MSGKKEASRTVGSAVVVGGGIGGMQTALDLAESGIKVYLVDKSSVIGGRMVALDKTFPTNECAMCVVSPKLVECGRHLNIEIITNTTIEKLEGNPGNFTITLKKKPRYIDEEKCTGCGACVIHCPVRNQITIIPEEKKTKVRLSPEIKSALTKIIDEHKNKNGSLMLILQATNKLYNYFSQGVLRYISQELDVPVSVILRIATFYNAFSLIPQGKHTISVCMGTACYVRGSERLLTKLGDILSVGIGETTKDLKFTLKSVRCLGCCSIAPVVMINDKVYGHLKLKEIPKILKDYK